MKKIIGILGVAVIAATMFFSTNNTNENSSDASLAGLMNMNVAHAQDGEGTGRWANYAQIEAVKTTTKSWKVSASGSVYMVALGTEGSYTTTTVYTYNCCKFGGSDCPQSLIFC